MINRYVEELFGPLHHAFTRVANTSETTQVWQCEIVSNAKAASETFPDCAIFALTSSHSRSPSRRYFALPWTIVMAGYRPRWVARVQSFRAGAQC